MDNIVEIRNLDFNYDNRVVFDQFSLNIKRGSFTTIVGPIGSGKSTLARIIYGLIDTKSFIKIDNMFLNPKNIKEIRKRIGIVFTNPENQFVCDKVYDDMVLELKTFGFSMDKIQEKIKYVIEILDLKSLISRPSHSLSGGEKELISFAVALALEPKILLLDEGLVMLDPVTRHKIFNLLREVNKKGVTIINIAQDSEEILEGKDVAIINMGKLILHKRVVEAFNDVKLFTDNDVSLPFIVDLSKKLQYYQVIDKTYFDSKKLVDALWK